MSVCVSVLPVEGEVAVCTGSFKIISQPAWQSLEDGWRLHGRATKTTGLCSFEKINKSSNNNPGYHCIPFE